VDPVDPDPNSDPHPYFFFLYFYTYSLSDIFLEDFTAVVQPGVTREALNQVEKRTRSPRTLDKYIKICTFSKYSPRARILEQSMGTRNRVGTELSNRPASLCSLVGKYDNP
jgi:hypothetical protein